jgi:type IV pilus biogenesis protein CpaD/CtpE
MKKITPYRMSASKKWFLLMIIAITGCETPQKVILPEAEKPYELKHETKRVHLRFVPHQAQLSHEEKTQFIALLYSLKFTDKRAKSSLHATLPHSNTRLGKQRLKSIIRTLLKSGLKPKQIHRNEEIMLPSCNKVAIDLDIYRAIPPLCPDWSTAYGKGYDRSSPRNYGCSTASNFLLMIDDPIILFKGEKPVAHDAARDSLAISDFKAGKDKGKWLRVEKTDGGGSGGGSGGSSGGGSGGGGS